MVKENLMKLIMLIEDMRYLRIGVSECADHMINCGVTIPVRCKDCIYYEYGKGYRPWCNNMNGLDEIHKDDFCSYGARKCNG